ncbi:MAG TPA: S8 family serine peptidase, partial [Candidatus Pacearchaeota archaeon]|nr:S8 family serine peptidase [Candidatus Pacearchaeota archaeon]
TFSQVIAGIEWTIQNKDKYDISVISMSLGASVNGDGTTPVEIAATTAAENGISFVVAAGNSGPRANSVGIPASAKKVIAVGAVDNNHEIASFSSRGPTKDDRIKPEVSAPGVSVMAPTANTYDSYHRWSGTSMATPHVAGVVALLKEADPELNTEEIREMLMLNALDKGEEGEDNTYGWGVVDVLQALLEISPQEHELLIKDIVVKDLYDTNTPIRLNTVIENKGLNDEENVNVKLYVNNVEISNRDIDEFKSGSTESAEFIYFPKKDGVYEMKVVVDTVPGETIVFDNEYSREVVVKDFEGIVSAVVLDSWGSEYNVYTIFDYLMENWNDFGEYSLDIDYTSFNNKEITYDDLKANGAEVLIISNAWQDGGYLSGLNWEFSDGEIEAIKKYVGEGHGLVVTAGSLSINAPGNVENNMKLAPLVGIDETSEGYWADYMDDSSFNINYAKHHLFDNMKDYYSSYYTTKDLKLDKGDLLARSKDDLSIITGHHYGKGNTIYFANFPEYYESYYSDKQAFYNALVWSTEMFEDNNINLRLENLEIDGLIKKGVQTNLKAQIVNQGGESQSEVIVKLLIDDNEIDIFQVESLASGESKEVTFSYIFEEVGSHNVEMIVYPLKIRNMIYPLEPLDNENKEYDNYLSKNVKVPRAFMTGNFVESTTDSDEDGLYDSLLINVEFEIFEEGHYDLSGLLTSQLGVELLQAYEWEFLEKGVNNLQLSFRGLDLRRWGLNGPYTLKNLRLYSEDERTNYDVEYQTEAYLADDFESYPDPSIDYIDRHPSRPFINDPVDIGIALENIGIESSSEITVELYERGEEFPDGSEDSDTLIGSTTTDGLGVFERSYVNFVVTPDKEGWIEYLVKITSEGDENLENNLYYFSIRVISDIPQFYSYWRGPYSGYDYADEVPIGQEFDIEANVYYDYGRPDVVRDVVVDLYKSVEIEGVRTKELIGSQDIGDLRKYEWGIAKFSYTPENLGELELIGELRAEDPINEDNSFTSHIQVIPNEADVLGDFTFKESYGIINTANIIYINVRNQGNNPARNVNVKLYDDGVEINDFSISRLGHGESVSLLSEWTPTTAGEHELELVVTADEDADLTNNAYSEIINVLDKKTLNFNIMNLLRESIPRYLTLDEDRYFVNVIPFITEIADIEESDIGINNIYADDTSYKDAFTVLLGSELTENMDVTTEYYEDIEDKGLEFSFIYANKPEWGYDGLSYNLLYYDEEVGVEDMSVYECSDWNFVDKICNINWVLNEEELKVINRDGNFIMGESTKNDIQALGLTLKEGVLIDDEPLERDDQDTTPASSSDISSDDTSSRRSRVGWRTTSFASTRGKKVSQSAFFSNKRAGETMKMKISNRMLPIDYIEITFKNEQKRGYLRFNQLDSPKGIPSQGNNVYAYFNIDHSNIVDNNVKSGKVEFKVDKSWFTQNNIKKENVVLSRYKDGFGWEEHPASPLKSDNKYDYYTSDITGMSIFAISAKELEVVEIPTQVVDKKESKKTETDVTDNKMWMIIGAVIIGILILVMIIVIVVVKNRKKRRLTTINGMKG